MQALEKRTAELKQKEARIALLESRLEALELRNNHSIHLTAGESLSDNLWQKGNKVPMFVKKLVDLVEPAGRSRCDFSRESGA